MASPEDAVPPPDPPPPPEVDAISMLIYLNLPLYINADGEPVAELPPDGEPTLIRSKTAQEFLAKIYFNTRNTYLSERSIKRVQLIWAGLAQDRVMPPLTLAEQRLMSPLGDREPLVQTVYSFMARYSKQKNTAVYEGLTSDLRERLQKVVDSLGYRSSRYRWCSNAISLGRALRRIELPLFQMGLNLYFGHTKMGTLVMLEWQDACDPRNKTEDPLSPGGGGSSDPSPEPSPNSVTTNSSSGNELARKVTKVRDPNALRPQPPSGQGGDDESSRPN